MKNYNNRLRSSIAILGVTCGSLLVALPTVAIAQVGEKLALANLPKQINQKVTHNSYSVAQAPQATPTPTQSPLPEQPASTPTPIQPPLPEQQQPPSTTMVLNQGKVSVKLVNQTGAKITYQAIGNTEVRSLSGKSDVTLKDLVAPITVTFKREDGGLLNATGQSPTPGVLEVTLDATTDLGVDKQSLQIQPTGDVFLN